MSQKEQYYDLQPSFNTGVISPEVANRTDLDKYRSALLTANNVFVRPFGSVYRRPGTQFCVAAKYGDRPCILYEFSYNADTSYLLEIGDYYIRVHKNGAYLGVEVATPFAYSILNSLRFAQSSDTLFIASGIHNVRLLQRYSETDWRMSEMDISSPYFDISNNGGAISSATITPSGIAGSITLTASAEVFNANMVGMCVKIWQTMASQIQTINATTSAAGTWTDTYSDYVYVGKSWTIQTNNNWSGFVYIEQSTDTVNWKSYRVYHSVMVDGTGDFNVSESGTFDTPTYIRVHAVIDQGTCGVVLTRMAYTHEGYVMITSYSSATSVVGVVVDKRLGDTSASSSYAFSCWCPYYGYPKCVTFFQDRLVLANNTRYPYAVWFSRSGDYYNFSTEEADGKVTDDSAMMLSLVNRKEYQIKHVMAGTDLIVFTDGNEWLISGSSTVTPLACTPKVQSGRGCTDVIPVMIGSRIIYVQRRGTTVRDFAYSFESDNYEGADLTILAKHLTKDETLTDVCYKQEPDSMLFFTTSSGNINALSYVNDQKVYAWSRITTNGAFEAITNITSGTEDTIYAVVRRTVNGATVRYIEKFSSYPNSTNPMAYYMLDSALASYSATTTASFGGFGHLANCSVDVLADGRCHHGVTVSAAGVINWGEAKVNTIIAGLPYTTAIEQPNFEVVSANNGSSQGKNKKISEAILRLVNSYGGRVGDTNEFQDAIHYDKTTNVTLFTGDKKLTVPNKPVGGYVNAGRIYILTAEPYPFELAAIIRVVTLGG